MNASTSKIACLFLLSVLTGMKGLSQDQEFSGWTHFSIDPVLPGSSWGTGGPALADYDGDGMVYHLDFRRNEQISTK